MFYHQISKALKSVNQMLWPSQSTDLSPTEHGWEILDEGIVIWKKFY
uniref:Uncharacterized protein n=1 Tax=Monopterus albus TaxID=43700 RepID=A0A3Q3JUD4_MONAL